MERPSAGGSSLARPGRQSLAEASWRWIPGAGGCSATSNNHHGTEYTQHCPANQGHECQFDKLNTHVAILAPAHVGKDSEEPEGRKRKDWQRSQEADHSEGKQDESEDTRGHVSVKSTHGNAR